MATETQPPEPINPETDAALAALQAAIEGMLAKSEAGEAERAQGQATAQPNPDTIITPASEEVPAESVVTDEERAALNAPFAAKRDAETGSKTAWQLPPTNLLSATNPHEPANEQQLAEQNALIERTFDSFGVPVKVRETTVGPQLIKVLLKPAEGISVKEIRPHKASLQSALGVKSLNIYPPVPGRPYVTIEIPNASPGRVGLREVLESPAFTKSQGTLRLAIGRDNDNKDIVGDLAKLPHLLIAGKTADVSEQVDAMIASLLFQSTPEELSLLMIASQTSILTEYRGLPHLKYPVVTDLTEASKLLNWTVSEMEQRYQQMAKAGYKNVEAYNNAITEAGIGSEKPIPQTVLVISELADLMLFNPNQVEPDITRLTAKAAEAGIHLVIATRNPDQNVITGLIKACMPSRIACQVSSATDSRVILDMEGAEKLLGKGDMLYLPYDQGKSTRLQGADISREEVNRLVEFWKNQGQPDYIPAIEVASVQLKNASAAVTTPVASEPLAATSTPAVKTPVSVAPTATIAPQSPTFPERYQPGIYKSFDIFLGTISSYDKNEAKNLNKSIKDGKYDYLPDSWLDKIDEALEKRAKELE